MTLKPLDLSHDPLGAAIRARPAQPPLIVWVHRSRRDAWCVLRRATGGRNIYLCCDWSPGNEPVHLLTSALDGRTPHNACPACSTELAAGTPPAVAVEEAQPRGPYLESYLDPTTGEMLIRRVDPAVNLDDIDDAPTPVSSRVPTADLLHRPLSGATEAINAQLQTPEAWARVWREE